MATESMIERVARKVADHDNGCGGETWEKYAELVRVTIEAMREPTEAMKAAGETHIPFHPESEGDEEVEIWKAMIDAALTPDHQQGTP